MRRPARLCLVLSIVAALAAPAAAQVSINVTQDCWPHQVGAPNNESENYCFAAGAPVRFVWKQKIMQTCSSYIAEIYIQQCLSGKPPLQNPLLVCRRAFGGLTPANQEERLFQCTSLAGVIPPGTWDWFLLTECDDTNGIIGLAADGNIDDECGINVGSVFGGPLVLGPEPAELWDPDPGDAAICRAPGEEGTTRGWCFTMM